LVLDRLGIQRTDIVGWSDGGIIALLLGLEAPQWQPRYFAASAGLSLPFILMVRLAGDF
jgi:pimeloyl-ACP methyl ester carboxylesterase